VQDASEEIVLRGGAALRFAGAVREAPTTDFRDVRRAATHKGVGADLVFLMTRNRQVLRTACPRPNAVGCALRGTDTGFLLVSLPASGPSPVAPVVDADRLGIVFIHEMGHLFGLGHSKDPRAVMFAPPTHTPLLTSEYVEAMWRYARHRN
jgi:hypothetical protein